MLTPSLIAMLLKMPLRPYSGAQDACNRFGADDRLAGLAWSKHVDLLRLRMLATPVLSYRGG
jgi:hypothetical protein